MSKARRHFDINEEADSGVYHDRDVGHKMCGQEQIAVTTIWTELWNGESGQCQDVIVSCAQDVDT